MCLYVQGQCNSHRIVIFIYFEAKAFETNKIEKNMLFKMASHRYCGVILWHEILFYVC